MEARLKALEKRVQEQGITIKIIAVSFFLMSITLLVHVVAGRG